MILTAIALTLAAPACQKYDANLPQTLAGWTRAGRDFDTGHAITLPRRGSGVHTMVRIRKAGTYGVALDQAGWIDVAPAKGKVLQSSEHAHGPQCSTIRKIVRYRLRPGTYRIDVTRLKGDRARLMLVRY
ncbi:MAG: hypothetical protein J7500_06100 [Sphingomonas sp.]|uniref:hypothetical protein n=1 Tax=Sphingomonas sp. TaxID=28214 RepID=UPI001B062999|nr:hypothetical protein [Sphingomonas sp.]MBO9622268.1 hypothetical protein [Sphingomonas sp.]